MRVKNIAYYCVASVGVATRISLDCVGGLLRDAESGQTDWIARPADSLCVCGFGHAPGPRKSRATPPLDIVTICGHIWSMGTAGRLYIYSPPRAGCGCASCDLCRDLDEAAVQTLVARMRAVAALAERQRELIVEAEDARFAAELAVY